MKPLISSSLLWFDTTSIENYPTIFLLNISPLLSLTSIPISLTTIFSYFSFRQPNPILNSLCFSTLLLVPFYSQVQFLLPELNSLFSSLPLIFYINIKNNHLSYKLFLVISIFSPRIRLMAVNCLFF